MNMKLPNELPPLNKLDEFGNLLTIESWLENVNYGFFIDYDGFGDLATAQGQSNYRICPSDITKKKIKIPSWVTHIMWYNR